MTIDLATLFGALPGPAQAACAVAAHAVLSRAVRAGWDKITKTDPATVFARVFTQWRDALAGDDRAKTAAFEAFFGSGRTAQEFQKVLEDRYEDVDFDVLEDEFQSACRGFLKFQVLTPDLAGLLDVWARDLHASLAQTFEFRDKYQTALQRAFQERSPEALIRNHSLARRRYLKGVESQHGLIRFAGMGAISGEPDVERVKVFVMPRIAPLERQPEADTLTGGRDRGGDTAAFDLLKGESRLVVILGRPGSGKTTLLESLALASAQGASSPFDWAKQLPSLLPVFFRVRDLDPYLEKNPEDTVWDFLRAYLSASTGETLPRQFFHRMMETRGLLVLVDGLDEAASTARRNRVVDRVSAFVNTLHKDSRVLITSRPYDYLYRFDPKTYRHFDLCPFNDDEIRLFIDNWSQVHELDHQKAGAKAEALWGELEKRGEIKELGRTALLLTMVVRLHFGSGVIPEGRLELYKSCAVMLLDAWAAVAGLTGDSSFGRTAKEKFLGQLAFEMQGEAGEQLRDEVAVQIDRRDLARRLESFLTAGGKTHCDVDKLVAWLSQRDAVLVDYGNDQFGFLHRSFQEYFAASWMASELEDEEFANLVWEQPPGWNETLYLAVAQLRDRDRRRWLLDLLAKNRVEFALNCMRAAAREAPWLATLVRFLSRYYRSAYQYVALTASECADTCPAGSAALKEVVRVLRGLFVKENRDGPALASAVELAEELARRGVKEAQALICDFFQEAEGVGLRSTAKMARVGSFYIDRYLVTNRDFECMVPSHPRWWGEEERDDQPVVNVSWYEARLFCRWRGPGFRLPAEDEWHKAAAWDPDKKKFRKYPWGDTFEPLRCNTQEKGPGRTTPVTAYPGGVSYYGCYDMAGNAWEWTASPWKEGSESFVVRGGAWGDDQGGAACACRDDLHPVIRGDRIGFRCART